MRHRMGVRLDLLQQAARRHHGDDALARLEAVDAVERGDQPREFVIVRFEPLEEVEIALQPNASFGVEDIDRPRAFRFVAPADLEIVEVVRRRDLDRAGALLRVGIGVGDDSDQPPDQRQAHLLADQLLKARIVGMHGDRAVAQHRLRTGGRDGDAFAGLLARGVDDGIVEIIEMAARSCEPEPWRAPPRRAARRRRATI